MESLSLSALEAAACGCPLLLSDLPWARNTFGEHAHYCPISDPATTAPHLRKFYDEALQTQKSFRPMSWKDVASQLLELYQRLLSTSS
jgi:glycosyltransferase involved in cell wall biosynthesis